MKFTCTVDIDKPIDKVILLFENPDNMKEWQDGFVSMTHISGIRGIAGAKSLLVYNTDNRRMELTETVLIKDLPSEMKALYEHTHMVNTMSNRFSSVGSNKTRWNVEIEYTKFNGFVPKMMALFTPGVFRKQTQKWLDQFKVFAEKS
ncbi:hypothetical protein WSM22_45650 [Cytophagales bacterium WSM2-2]|nr:hypothetical protein WSM22_45650 [Cytophagales bacterium WSM2-2]